MDRIDLFKPGHPRTPLSASEMNQLVRALNAFLKLSAAPPLRLIKADKGWLLMDTAFASDSSVKNDTFTPSPSCAIPIFDDAIGTVASLQPTVHCGGAHSNGAQADFIFCPVIGTTTTCNYTLDITIRATLPTSGGYVVVFLDSEPDALQSDTGGSNCGTVIKETTYRYTISGAHWPGQGSAGFYLIITTAGSSHHLTTCNAEIIDVELVSSEEAP